MLVVGVIGAPTIDSGRSPTSRSQATKQEVGLLLNVFYEALWRLKSNQGILVITKYPERILVVHQVKLLDRPLAIDQTKVIPCDHHPKRS
jgi:hypothetical protein